MVLAVVMRFIVMRSVILLLWINRFIPFRTARGVNVVPTSSLDFFAKQLFEPKGT